MTAVYFDSSSLVKLVTEEPGSELAVSLWDSCRVAASSRLAHPEVCAALAAGRRNHDLGRQPYISALRQWQEIWEATTPVELTSAVEQLPAPSTWRASLLLKIPKS